MSELVCGQCGAPIKTVAVEPVHTDVGDWLAELHDAPRPVTTHAWVCTNGHRLGFIMDVGHLDLGIVRDTTLNQVTELQGIDSERDPLGYWEGTGPLAGFDFRAARARVVATGREFFRTLFLCSGCEQWRVEPMNELQMHLLGGPGAPTCHACHSYLARNDIHIFMEEFTTLTSTGFAAVTGNTHLDSWIESHVTGDPTVQRRVRDYEGPKEGAHWDEHWKRLYEQRPTEP